MPSESEPSTYQASEVNADIIIVGAGFSGCYALHKLRLMGFTTKILEAGTGFGGVWHLNRYPGARVDSETPTYQLNLPEVWTDFSFSQRYPGHEELRKYFSHLNNSLTLQKDTIFGARVSKVEFNQTSKKWTFHTQHGLRATSTYAIFAVGTSCKPHIPEWPGLCDYKGQIIHPAAWPEDFDAGGKKIGVIGQGASGLQIVQELAKEDCQLAVFIRTPSMCIPMNQKTISIDDSENTKTYYNAILNTAKYNTEAAYPFNVNPRSWYNATEDERRQHFEWLWKRGGFAFLLSNFWDTLVDKTANADIYSFWANKVRARISDPIKRDILAPLEQPYWVGTKRPSLEQDYYESIDRPNVKVVDLKKTPIKRFDVQGIVTGDKEKDQLSKLDAVVVATGYDNITGSLFDMNIHDKHGVKLQNKWRDGIRTHLGMAVPGCPNAFFLYGPQAPSSLANGPPFIELQVDWLAQLLGKMQNEKIVLVEASNEAAETWAALVSAGFERTLSKETILVNERAGSLSSLGLDVLTKPNELSA
ncbi:Flavin-binding monooxygenase, partial [Pyrenophora tritici-repentis]